MKNTLETIGQILQISANAQVPAGGANSINADLPQGPVDQDHIWIVEYASADYSDLGGKGTETDFDTIGVISVGQNPVKDPADSSLGIIDFPNRGIVLPTENYEGGGGGIANTLIVLMERGFVIPYGSTLRAVKSGAEGAHSPLTQDSVLTLRATVRVIDLSCC